MKNEIIQMILGAVGGTGGTTGIVIAIINARTKLQLAKISAENGIQIEDRRFKCGIQPQALENDSGTDTAN